MKRLSHVLTVLSSATMSLGTKTVKRVAPVVIGAAIVFAAYLTLTGLKPPALRSKAQVQPGLKSPALLGLKVPMLPDLRSVLSLPKVHAQPGCSISTLNGNYSGYAWGSASGTLSNSVSLWNFNGAGSATLSWWAMNGGSYSSGTNTYSYTVNSPTCEGTLYNGSTTYDTFTIANNGGEIFLMSTVKGWNLVNVAKLRTEGCSLANDTFSGFSWGSSSGIQNNSVNIYDFSNSGTVTGTDWIMYGGSYSTSNFNYTYTLNSNCQGTITYGSTLIGVFTVVPGTPAEVFVLDTIPSSNIMNDLKQY